VTDAIGHGHHGETEGDSNAQETDCSAGEDCSTATAENKNERAEKFGEEFVTSLNNFLVFS